MRNEEIFTAIPVLETEHYVLRGMRSDDAIALFSFMNDRDTMKFITSDPVQTEAALREEIEHQLSNFSKQKEIPWVIIDKHSREVVGTFSLYKVNLWHRKADMGVIIRKAYQKKGVMTEILEKVLAFGFGPLGLNRIVGDIFASNQGSDKLLRKYGFKKEGVLRQTDYDGDRFHDTVVYSLLKTEYDARKKV